MDDTRLERIEKKIDDVREHLSSIDVTLSQQHMSLKEHIRRTELLEEELKPIKRHVTLVEGAVKLISFVAAIAGILALIQKIIWPH